jgi:hypothetical protein
MLLAGTASSPDQKCAEQSQRQADILVLYHPGTAYKILYECVVDDICLLSCEGRDGGL